PVRYHTHHSSPRPRPAPPHPPLFPYTTLFRSTQSPKLNLPRTGGPNNPSAYPFRARKIAAWTTLDLIASYTFNLPRFSAHGKDTDRKSTRLNSSHVSISYAVFCLKKKIRCGPD